jgi:hypothetical protein
MIFCGQPPAKNRQDRKGGENQRFQSGSMKQISKNFSSEC